MAESRECFMQPTPIRLTLVARLAFIAKLSLGRRSKMVKGTLRIRSALIVPRAVVIVLVLGIAVAVVLIVEAAIDSVLFIAERARSHFSSQGALISVVIVVTAVLAFQHSPR